MVEIMTTPMKDYEYSDETKSDDVVTREQAVLLNQHNGDVDTDDTDDDGDDELDIEMEEGEICDEDDVEGRLGVNQMSIASFDGDQQQTSSNSIPLPQQPVPAFIIASRRAHYQHQQQSGDREEMAAGDRASEGSMLSSWMSGVKQRAKQIIPVGVSPTIDANEEYYGYSSNSPVDPAADKDYRNRNSDSTDKDYRWLRDEDGHRNNDVANEFGDSDYRGNSPKLERRRRRTPSPSYGGPKRIRHSPPVRGNYRGRGFRGRWGERQICKFFREGYCRDGDNCAYSHDAADSGRKAELCKFYQQGFCKKGLQCPLLHGEYPCKAYHKGECSKDPCQFSHLPLNNFTQPIFSQMIKDDEFASRIAIPQGPLKRRVLLPGGPSSSPGSQSSPVVVSDGGIIPPPSIVVPTLSSCVPQPGIAQPQLVVPAAPLSVATGVHSSYPAFFPHHSMPAPTLVEPVPISIALPPPSAESVLSAHQYAVSLEKRNAQDDEDDGSFNINKILEQITAKVKKEDDSLIGESPASPPMFDLDSANIESTPTTIPDSNVPVWNVVIMEIPNTPAVDPEILRMSFTSSTLRSDPRVKKALSAQFDEFTSAIMNSSLQPNSSSSQGFTTDANLPFASTTVETSVALKEQINVPKVVDPRTVNSRDPRRRALAFDPRSLPNDSRITVTDPRISSTITSRVAITSVGEQMNGGTSNMQTPASARINTDYLYSPALAVSRDHDHRIQSTSYQEIGNCHQEDRFGERSCVRAAAGGSGWMPQAHLTNDSRSAKKLGLSIHRNEYGSQDRDERELNHVSRSEDDEKLSSVSAPPLTQPISLREKRKNNEYESPLSRIPGSSRWNQ